ncbi:MAG TPA: glycerol-3-phosphate 1-O-acyltransferase PlsY [Gammaproteobacteria bacterium]
MTLIDIALVLGAYLLGSLSTAIILCRLMGLPDPRTQGSGNPGATNVLRFGGKKLAAFTLLGDMLKGLLPVVVARFITSDATVLALVAMAAFLGHLYPVFFGFRGGKGVATALGVLLGLSWPVGVAVLLTWVAMALLFRISSLSALTAAALSPLYGWWLTGIPAYIVMMAVMATLLLWRHRSNIQRLLAGEEKRIGKK